MKELKVNEVFVHVISNSKEYDFIADTNVPKKYKNQLFCEVIL